MPHLPQVGLNPDIKPHTNSPTWPDSGEVGHNNDRCIILKFNNNYLSHNCYEALWYKTLDEVASMQL